MGRQIPARLKAGERKRIRERLDYAEDHARAMLSPYKQLLRDMAQALVNEREFDAEAVRSWLADVPQKGAPEQFLDR